ncbi:MAG: hypothetical protein HW400_732, partial [Candidatus Levybacteria bacterium]|nr:hypothetical protein [Candidatus Levybacteria bacterium]
ALMNVIVVVHEAGDAGVETPKLFGYDATHPALIPVSVLNNVAALATADKSDFTVEFFAAAIFCAGLIATNTAAAKIPKIATTIRSSIRVKPFGKLRPMPFEEILFKIFFAFINNLLVLI